MSTTKKIERAKVTPLISITGLLCVMNGEMVSVIGNINKMKIQVRDIKREDLEK